jgi:hypothetical protein
MAVFREQVRETLTKYKMLWFVVDTYHRQRYFFICGFKQTVTKIPVQMGAGRVAMGPEVIGLNHS